MIRMFSHKFGANIVVTSLTLESMTIPAHARVTALARQLKETYFWNSHSRLSKGQTLRVFSQREMQCWWKACFTDGQVRQRVEKAKRRAYIARAPSYRAVFLTGRIGVGLTLNAQIHNVVAANSTIVYLNVP